jgi:hypothetical protein
MFLSIKYNGTPVIRRLMNITGAINSRLPKKEVKKLIIPLYNPCPL